MPVVERSGAPALHYDLEDHTDPWRNAPTILLQHGYGRYARFWYSWLPYLSRHYRILCPDMRGFGRSTRGFDPQAGFRFDDLVADIVAILDAAEVERVHYVGEAFGGTLGMQLAAQHPQRVRSLGLVSSPVFLNQTIQGNYALGEASWFDALRKHGVRKWAQATNTIARFPPHVGQGFLDWYSDELAKTDAETLIAFSRLCSTYDMRAFLPAITAPVLGVYPRTRPEQVALLRAGLRDFSYVEIESDYLMIYNVFPRQCARAVLDFVARCDGMALHE